MRRCAGTLGLVLLAAVAARAAETPVPLEKSQEELKALQKDRTAPGGDTAMGGLRDALPATPSPVPGANVGEAALHKNSDSDLKKKKEKDAAKNWLLDGMDKLDRTPKRKGPDARGTSDETGDDRDQPDPNEPVTLLEAYSEQQKNEDAKAAARQTTTPRADPLAPFLQGWLAGSPVRGKFFDEYLKKPDAVMPGGGPAAPAPRPESNETGGVPGLDAGGGFPRGGPGGGNQSANNPYLQGLDLAGLADGSSRGPLTAAPASTPAGGFAPARIPVDPPPAVAPPERKPPPPPLADDKKYFPQLKKF